MPPVDLGGAARRIFKCAWLRLIGFVGEGLSGTERTDAACEDMVTKGRLTLLGVCGFVNVLVIILDSILFAGGIVRATEGGLLGGAFDEARNGGGILPGEAGMGLSSLCELAMKFT